MKMTKIILKALLLCGLLTGCGETTTTLNVNNYTIAYITSEVQEYTHDLRMGHCEDDIYIEVPYDYSKNTVKVRYTGRLIEYWVEDSDIKVSNKGYELEG